jgi:hypothetical protein
LDVAIADSPRPKLPQKLAQCKSSHFCASSAPTLPFSAGSGFPGISRVAAQAAVPRRFKTGPRAADANARQCSWLEFKQTFQTQTT